MSAIDTAVATEPQGADVKHKRTASSAATTGIYTAEELKAANKTVTIASDVAKLNWKINTSPSTCQEPDILKKFVCTPPISKVELRTPTGITYNVRNKKGITIKDCFDVMWKTYRKKADDELDTPILDKFLWDPENGSFSIELKKEPDHVPKKKK